MEEIVFNFKHDGICGTVYLPKADAASLPTAIFCHGWGGTRKLFRFTEQLKGMLRKRSVAVVTFDFFGCGESEGATVDITYAKWAENVASVAEWTKAQKFADPDKIGLVAFSSGSTAAFRYALASPPAFLILVATCVSANVGMSEGGPFGRTGGSFLGVEVGKEFFKDCVANAPMPRLGEIACPTLLLQGDADNEFRIADSIAAHEKIKGSEIKIFSGAPHSLSTHARQAARFSVEWLKSIYII